MAGSLAQEARRLVRLRGRFHTTRAAASAGTAWRQRLRGSITDHSLPANERAQAGVFTVNYGEASALTLLGSERGMAPPVVSGHHTYWVWGLRGCSGQVVVTVGRSLADEEQPLGNVRQAALSTCAYSQPEENTLAIVVCTQPKGNVSALWERLKHCSS